MSSKTLLMIILGLLVVAGAGLLLERQKAARGRPAGSAIGSSAVGHGNAADAPQPSAPKGGL